jgi:hypothetical protein
VLYKLNRSSSGFGSAFLLITGLLKMFGKNDWLIKIRYTGSGSKKMNVAAAAALLSVCLCVRKEGGKTSPPYIFSRTNNNKKPKG